MTRTPTDPSPRPLVQRIGGDLRRIAATLRELGFRFDHPDAVLPGPEAGANDAIARIEREVGAAPLGLTLFWTEVGSVDFRGSHPDWHGCEYPDPLVVYPPSIAIEELDTFLADYGARMSCDFPYAIPVAPDECSKADVSGGMWYNIDVPAVDDDPPLNDEPHETTFLKYLEIAVRWGGFPGLESCNGHTWPLAALTTMGA